MSQRTAILAMAGLGDLVFTLPSVEGLARAGHCVTLVTRPPLAALARRASGVSHVFVWDKRDADASPLGTLRAARRLAEARGVDVLLAPHPSIRSGLFAWLSGAPRRVGWGPVGYTTRVERGPRFIEDVWALAERVGARREDFAPPRLPREGWPSVSAAPQSPGTIAILPGANYATKRPAPALLEALLARLDALRVPTVLIGGAGEAPAFSGPSRPASFGEPLDLVAGLLVRCRAVVGGDTGLIHLARALGVPTVTLWGPTDRGRLPADPGRVDLERVDVSCRPCSPHGPRRCPRVHHACMRLHEADAVLESLQALGAV